MNKWNNKFRYQVASCWLFILSLFWYSICVHPLYVLEPLFPVRFYLVRNNNIKKSLEGIGRESVDWFDKEAGKCVAVVNTVMNILDVLIQGKQLD